MLKQKNEKFEIEQTLHATAELLSLGDVLTRRQQQDFNSALGYILNNLHYIRDYTGNITVEDQKQEARSKIYRALAVYKTYSHRHESRASLARYLVVVGNNKIKSLFKQTERFKFSRSFLNADNYLHSIPAVPELPSNKVIFDSITLLKLIYLMSDNPQTLQVVKPFMLADLTIKSLSDKLKIRQKKIRYILREAKSKLLYLIDLHENLHATKIFDIIISIAINGYKNNNLPTINKFKPLIRASAGKSTDTLSEDSRISLELFTELFIDDYPEDKLPRQPVESPLQSAFLYSCPDKYLDKSHVEKMYYGYLAYNKDPLKPETSQTLTLNLKNKKPEIIQHHNQIDYDSQINLFKRKIDMSLSRNIIIELQPKRAVFKLKFNRELFNNYCLQSDPRQPGQVSMRYAEAFKKFAILSDGMYDKYNQDAMSITLPILTIYKDRVVGPKDVPMLTIASTFDLASVELSTGRFRLYNMHNPTYRALHALYTSSRAGIEDIAKLFDMICENSKRLYHEINGEWAISEFFGRLPVHPNNAERISIDQDYSRIPSVFYADVISLLSKKMPGNLLPSNYAAIKFR